ncbi:hypothetical protein Fcan01_13551 [Folsomia candida]|uniref:Uncharacterized protein n=1 Tax=Folsomia candida TaxID=158441 RepID=A0A226E246_FOLCA|nr:hypothetical protein Fcan01_13551 [Folsomia candida]
MLLIIKGSHRDSFVLCHTNGDDANEHYCSLPVRRTALRLRNYNGTKDAKSNGECGRKFQLCVAPFDARRQVMLLLCWKEGAAYCYDLCFSVGIKIGGSLRHLVLAGGGGGGAVVAIVGGRKKEKQKSGLKRGGILTCCAFLVLWEISKRMEQERIKMVLSRRVLTGGRRGLFLWESHQSELCSFMSAIKEKKQGFATTTPIQNKRKPIGEFPRSELN